MFEHRLSHCQVKFAAALQSEEDAIARQAVQERVIVNPGDNVVKM